jgi:hypothetical protein
MSEETSFWKRFEKAKKILEVIAIFVAAWWAFTRFKQEEEPLLATRADIQGNLDWNDYTKDTCQAEYEVQFQNIGKTPIEIGRVRLSVWTFDDPKEMTQTENVRMLVPLKMPTEPPLLQEDTDRLADVYGPGESDKHGFSFLVKRSANKDILFKVELWPKGDSASYNKDPLWSDYRWDFVCGESPVALEKRLEEKANKPSQPPVQ